MSAHLATSFRTATLMLLLSTTSALAQESLPRPRTEGGKPLMQTLSERASSREFSSSPLAPQVLGDLLWAAAGINRPETGHRTTPTARNRQEIDVYVATAAGLFRYDPKAHALDLVVAKDLRAATGQQDFVGVAPVNLIYVADLSRLGAGVTEQDQVLYPAVATGAMVQSVYLYAASAGLATVVRAMVDRQALASAMGLRPDQRVILCQTVGMPGGD